MAFGDYNKVDNDRQIHAPTIAGDDIAAEGAFETQLQPGTGPQALPDPNLQGDGVYDAASVISGRGDSELLGGDVEAESSQKDDNYPNLPAGVQDGTMDLNFDSVGPYHYPDFGNWPGQPKTAFQGALRAVRD